MAGSAQISCWSHLPLSVLEEECEVSLHQAKPVVGCHVRPDPLRKLADGTTIAKPREEGRKTNEVPVIFAPLEGATELKVVPFCSP